MIKKLTTKYGSLFYIKYNKNDKGNISMYFYTNTSNDAPKLKNRYGDLNKVINYLIDGGSEYSVSKIEPNAAKVNTVKVYYNESLSPFVQFQTIVISGSLVSQYNTHMFIESVNPVEKYYVCYKSTFTSDLGVDTNTNIKIKIKNSGITRKFGGVANFRTVIKFNGGIEYRIDDRDFRPLVTPPVTITTANENWLKCARITMCESFDTLDSTSTRYFPYNNDRPTVNFQPIGKFIGTGAWIQYNRTDTTYSITQSTANDSENEMSWKVFADDETLILILNSTTTTYRVEKHVFVMGNYQRNNTNRLNGILFCFGETLNTTYGYDSTATFPAYYSYTPMRNLLYTYMDSEQSYSAGQVSLIYDNGEGNVGSMVRVPEFRMSPSASGMSEGYALRNVNSFDAGTYFCDVLLTNSATTGSYEVYGKLRNMKWVCSSMVVAALAASDGRIYVINNEMYYSYHHAYGSAGANVTTNLIKLTRS